MKKALKRIFTVIICMPIVLIVLFIGYEIIGIAVNDYSANKQTKNLLDDISNVSDIEILDSYTYCGNTGNGNHVDMLSLVLIRTENDTDEIDYNIYGDYKIISCDYLKEHDFDNRFYNELDFPQNTENCYIIRLFNSAPFVDNIVGH